MQNVIRGSRLGDINIEKNTKIRIRTWLLILYLFFAPLDFLPAMYGVSISSVLIFLPLIGSFFSLKYMRIRFDKFFILPVLYIIVIITTLIFSYDVPMSEMRAKSIMMNIVAILVLSMFDYNMRELINIKKAIVFSGWLTLLLMILYADTSSSEGRLVVIVNGIYQDPNELCGYLIFSIMYYWEEFQKGKGISILKVGVFIVLALLTGSRGGLLAILGSILFYVIVATKTKINRIRTTTIAKTLCLIFTVGVFLKIAIDKLPESLINRYNVSYSMSDGGANRFGIWESILSQYKHSSIFNKLFGWGAGTIRHFTYNGSVGHNIWIESLMEIGLIGVIVLFIFYFIYFRKAYQIKEYIVAATFVGYMIMAMSLSLYSYKPIWNIILLIMIFKNSKKNVNNNMIKGKQLRE